MAGAQQDQWAAWSVRRSQENLVDTIGLHGAGWCP
jgi:hypothetical protein